MSHWNSRTKFSWKMYFLMFISCKLQSLDKLKLRSFNCKSKTSISQSRINICSFTEVFCLFFSWNYLVFKKYDSVHMLGENINCYCLECMLQVLNCWRKQILTCINSVLLALWKGFPTFNRGVPELFLHTKGGGPLDNLYLAFWESYKFVPEINLQILKQLSAFLT